MLARRATFAAPITVLRTGRLVGTRDTDSLERKDLVSMMLGRELVEETRHTAAPTLETGRSRFRFKAIGRKGAIEPFDLDIAEGEVVGLAGLLGSGRTETAEVMFGARPSDQGTIEIDGQAVASCCPAATSRRPSWHAGWPPIPGC